MIVQNYSFKNREKA